MAKIRKPAPTAPGNLPPELLDPLHPLWRDAEALQAHPDFGPYVDEVALSRLRMTGGRYRQFNHVGGAWLVANGFESREHPGFVDWHAFRAAVGAARD